MCVIILHNSSVSCRIGEIIMANVTKVQYYTQDKYELISQENILIYERYLKSNSIKNKDTFESSYIRYQKNFMYFLVFLAEKYNNIGLYSDDFRYHRRLYGFLY